MTRFMKFISRLEADTAEAMTGSSTATVVVLSINADITEMERTIYRRNLFSLPFESLKQVCPMSVARPDSSMACPTIRTLTSMIMMLFEKPETQVLYEAAPVSAKSVMETMAVAVAGIHCVMKSTSVITSNMQPSTAEEIMDGTSLSLYCSRRDACTDIPT